MRSIDNAPLGGEDERRVVARFVTGFARAVFAFVVRAGFFARAVLRSAATVLSVDWGS
jgi:hypothetical protein